MDRTITLEDGRTIGTGHPCFIIAEAGSNWRMGTSRRDLAMARALVDVAYEAGCDAVKFQTYRPETVYVRNAGTADYLSEAGHEESIQEVFSDLAMPYELIEPIASYCKRRGIRFMSTPFSVEDAAEVDPFVVLHKIASYEISHVVLQDYLARTGKPIVFSCGASNWSDIDYAVERLSLAGASGLAVMQCTARYPAPLDSLHLRVIPSLRERYRIPVGFSDHSREPSVGPAAAVALGANIIEKHFTLSNRLPGADHPYALEPSELAQMVASIRATEAALGNADKCVNDVEAELASFARRGVQATVDIEAGDVLELGKNIAILRPGKRSLGVHPRFLDRLESGRATRRISAGDGVLLEDIGD